MQIGPSLLVVAVLGAVGLAGCVETKPSGDVDTLSIAPADGLREILHGLGEIVQAAVPLPDGLLARGTVYLPDVPAETKVPVIMDLGPYYGNLNPPTASYNTERPPNVRYAYFLERGYAIALMSVRGTGQSEGCFKIGGHEEQRDAAAIVEWLASQEWSNGKVAMTGVSYDGTTPWEAAVTGTPGLAAIVPVSGISDMYRYSFFEGVPLQGGTTFNTYYYALVDTAHTDTSEDGVAAWGSAQPTNVCPEAAEVILDPYGTWQDGVHDAFWDERDTSAMLSNLRAAPFVVHGLQDWNVKPDHVQYLWNELPEPKRMLLGQWEHNIPWRNTFNEDWNYEAYNETILEWFDAFLLDDLPAKERTLSAAPVLAQDSTGEWWELDAWPPAQTISAPLHLTASGRLSPSSSDGAHTFSFRSAPSSQLADSGASSFRERVAFSSRTLTAPLHLMGNPEATVTVSVDQPGGYLNLVLWDVDAAGSWTRVTPGHLNLANRESRDSFTEVPTETPLTVTMKMYATAHVFQPGHRLVLTFSGGDAEAGHLFPVSKDPLTTFTLHVGSDAPGEVRLPVWRGGLPAMPP